MQNYYQYSAFGESIVAEETTQNHLRYNAQISDDLTGLYYLRARYYNPTTGRFTQEDVIYNDGLNLYAYCNSNPVMYCDPSGFAKKDNEIHIEIIDNTDFKDTFPILGKSHTKTSVTGTVFSKGKVNTIDRVVYQMNDIDWDYVSSNPANRKMLSNRQLAHLGKVPFGLDDQWIELHHLTQNEPGSMIEIMGSKHDKYSKQLHGIIEAGESFRNNDELAAQYEKFRKEYWKERIEKVELLEQEKKIGKCKKKGG